MMDGRSLGSAVRWTWVLTRARQPQGCVNLRKGITFLGPGFLFLKTGTITINLAGLF